MEKFPVTKRALTTIEKVMNEQDQFGLEKYGKPLDHGDKYDWMEMFLQEMADGLKYIQCEMDRKEFIINILKTGLRSNDPKEHIEVALELLNPRGHKG